MSGGAEFTWNGGKEIKKGERVRVIEGTGTFEGYEGTLESVNFTTTRVVVVINIFGRPTQVELEHWQIEPM